MLKENTNIDEDQINTIFKKFKIGDELDYDINVSNFLGITLINLRKKLSKKMIKY